MLKELSKVEQRYDAVVAVIRDGMAVTEVAQKFGVSTGNTSFSCLAAALSLLNLGVYLGECH